MTVGGAHELLKEERRKGRAGRKKLNKYICTKNGKLISYGVAVLREYRMRQ